MINHARKVIDCLDRRSHGAATGGYVIAYAVTLASFIVIWFNHSILLYIGRDANLSLWLNKAYADWAYPLDVTAVNPFQGVTGMLMPINPYFNPGTWIFQPHCRRSPSGSSRSSSISSKSRHPLSSSASRRDTSVFAFVGALWLAFLLFLTFNFVYGLQGCRDQSSVRPHAGAQQPDPGGVHPDSRREPDSGRPRTPQAHAQLAACIVLLLLLIILAAPFYNGGMLVGQFCSPA